MGKWGSPKGFTDYAITRGDGSAYEGAEGSEESVSTSTGRKATVATGEEDDETSLSKTSILGG